MIQPLDRTQWADPNIAFGVEIKRDPTITGDYARHLAQCVDYSNTQWDGYGYLHILAFPSFIPHRASDAGLIHRIAGRLGVGCIEKREYYGVGIFLNGHTIWSEKQGLVEGKRWELKRKFGSR